MKTFMQYNYHSYAYTHIFRRIYHLLLSGQKNWNISHYTHIHIIFMYIYTYVHKHIVPTVVSAGGLEYLPLLKDPKPLFSLEFNLAKETAISGVPLPSRTPWLAGLFIFVVHIFINTININWYEIVVIWFISIFLHNWY